MKLHPMIITAALLATPAVAQHEERPPEPQQEESGSGDHAEKFTPPQKLHAQTVCPVSGEELEDREVYRDYEGHRIDYCCRKCLKKTAGSMERLAMKMYADGVLLENVQEIDPVTGEPLETREHAHRLYNKRIFVNAPESLEKVAADPARYLDVLAGRTPQKRCAVRGGEVDPGAAFVVEGMSVGQCCPGCDAKWFEDPAKHFAVLEERGEVVEPATMTCPVMPTMDGSKRFPVTLGSKRYYLCSEAAAWKFVMHPDEYLPAWRKAVEGGSDSGSGR